MRPAADRGRFLMSNEAEMDLPGDAPALIVDAAGGVELARQPLPDIGPREILVQTEFSGVSIGTERWAAAGKIDVWGPPPFVPGYQAVGRVVAVGAQADRAFAVDDAVACFAIGAHRRYLSSEMAFAHRIAPNELLRCAALFVQPVVGANALNLAGVEAGDNVMVIGQGLIGQVTAQLARLRGAYVITTDVSPKRLAISDAHCADWAIDAEAAPPSRQIGERFPAGVDVVIESTGFVPLVDDAMRCLRQGGTFAFAGYYPGRLSFDFDTPHEKEIRAVFPCGVASRDCRESILRMILSGHLHLDALLTDIPSWRQAAERYAELLATSDASCNAMVIDWRQAQ